MHSSALNKTKPSNPIVKLIADSDLLDKKGVEYFKKFTIVISTKLNSDHIVIISGSWWISIYCICIYAVWLWTSDT